MSAFASISWPRFQYKKTQASLYRKQIHEYKYKYGFEHHRVSLFIDRASRDDDTYQMYLLCVEEPDYSNLITYDILPSVYAIVVMLHGRQVKDILDHEQHRFE